MVLRRHSSTLPVRSPNRPVLVKSSRALDGRRIRPRRLVEVVRGPVALDGAEMGSSRGGVIGAVTLHDVEFDQRTGRPAVHGEVAVSAGLPGAAVGDRSESISLNLTSRERTHTSRWPGSSPSQQQSCRSCSSRPDTGRHCRWCRSPGRRRRSRRSSSSRYSCQSESW